MGLHTGDPCFYCQKVLRENDDVVVCPECGTPYHRACYQEAGSCVNHALHESGGSWTRIKLPQEATKVEMTHCSNCGAENDVSSQRCQNCGVPLHTPYVPPSLGQQDTTPPASTQSEEKHRESLRERIQHTAEQMGIEDPYGAMNPEEQIGKERLGDMADFVAKNQIYFLPKFLRFARENRRISLNCPCLLFPQLYFAYRKMLPLALVLAGIFALIQMPQMAQTLLITLPDMIASFSSEGNQLLANLYPNAPELMQGMLDQLKSHQILIENLVTVCNYLDLCLSIVFGLLGNWIYYRHAYRRVEKVCSAGFTGPIRRMRLRQEGGTNGWLIVVVIVVEYVLVTALTMVLMLLLM